MAFLNLEISYVVTLQYDIMSVWYRLAHSCISCAEIFLYDWKQVKLETCHKTRNDLSALFCYIEYILAQLLSQWMNWVLLLYTFQPFAFLYCQTCWKWSGLHKTSETVLIKCAVVLEIFALLFALYCHVLVLNLCIISVLCSNFIWPEMFSKLLSAFYQFTKWFRLVIFEPLLLEFFRKTWDS